MAQIIESHQVMGRALGLAGRGTTIVVVSLVMTSISLLLVVNRISFSMIRGKTFRADDCAIVASLVSINFVRVAAVQLPPAKLLDWY